MVKIYDVLRLILGVILLPLNILLMFSCLCISMIGIFVYAFVLLMKMDENDPFLDILENPDVVRCPLKRRF